MSTAWANDAVGDDVAFATLAGMRLAPDLLHAIDRLGQAQGGHVGRWQLLALGVAPSVAARLPRRLGWTTVHAGTYRLLGAPVTPTGSMWAALLAVADAVQRKGTDHTPADGVQGWEAVHARLLDGVAITGLSAAWLMGLIDNPPTVPQILVPHRLQRRLSGIRVVRTRVWPTRFERHRELPTADAVRTLWDCGWLMRHDHDAGRRMRKMMSRADGLRLCSAPDLHLVAKAPREFGLPGVVPEPFLSAARSLAGGHSHSGAEHRARQIVTEIAATLGLAVEPRPFVVVNENGVRVAEADIAIPLIRFNCEIDGPHHDDPAQQARDRWRDAQMRQIPWTVRRYRDSMVRESEGEFRDAVEADIRQTAAAMDVGLAA